MRKRILALFLLAAAGAVTAQEPELASLARPDALPFTIEQLYNTRTIGSACWSPDGATIAFISNISGRLNIWTVPSAGGWPTQLTVSEEEQSELAWAPDGKLLAYVSDYGGDEQYDIFVISPETAQTVNLTNTRLVSEESVIWSADGKAVAFARKPKEASNYEVCTRSLSEPRVLSLTSATPPDLSNWPIAFSSDGKMLVYNQVRADDKDSNVFIVDMATAKSRLLTPHKGEAFYSATAMSPDGTRVLMTSNAANGFMNAALLEVATGKIEWLTSDTWETTSGAFSPDGRSVTWTSNIDGNSDVHVRELAGAKTTTVPMKKGVNSEAAALAFSADGTRLLIRHSGPDSPSDLWVYDRAAGKPNPITSSLVGGLRASDFVEPYLVHYPTYDDRQISALLYIPHNIRRSASAPGIVWIHGGPNSQSVNAFNRGIQFLVNKGYVVIAPNYRGSTGYGKEFENLNRFDMGGGDLMDVLYAAQFLVKKTGYVDPKKLIAYGGSYGGYLTMMAVTKSPDVWAAGVNLYGFVNWFTEMENEDPLLRRYDLATMGDPVKDKARFEERSPINFVDKIRAPLLVMVGGNDPRCPKSESDQIVQAIRNKGGIVEYKIYEGEGHGFAKRENQIDAIKRAVDFLDAQVKNRTAAQ